MQIYIYTHWELFAPTHQIVSLHLSLNLPVESLPIPLRNVAPRKVVQALRSAEACLDAFWATLDKTMTTNTCNLWGMAVGNLLSQRGILQRTPKWVGPTEPSPMETAVIKREGNVDTYFGHNPTSGVPNIPPKQLHAARPKTKIKTRGIPRHSTAMTNAEMLTQATPAGQEVTLC
jgi:hypothetical protein